MEKIRELLKVVNGRKTAIGLFLYVIGGLITHNIDPETGGLIADFGLSLTGIGAAHKIWKGG